jgi:hypothetical protein
VSFIASDKAAPAQEGNIERYRDYSGYLLDVSVLFQHKTTMNWANI